MARVSTFVLLHGMCHGAWCWDRVAPMLRQAGHRVFTPTQVGVGERVQELHEGITLEDFVNDVVDVLQANALTDTVLVGHSFGGHAISGAAHRVPGRIRHLVYLDGVVPIDSVSPLDQSAPAIAEARRAAAKASGGLSLPAPDPSVFGIPAGPDHDWVRGRLTPHPFGTLVSALRLSDDPSNGLPATYVVCTDPLYAGLASARDRARSHPAWHWREIASGHDCMVTAPRETADILMEIAE